VRAQGLGDAWRGPALCALQEAAILPGTAAQGVPIFSQRMAKIIRYAAFLTTTGVSYGRLAWWRRK